MIKRFILFIASALVVLGCSENRTDYLKVYNWSSYIDETLINEFEQWYKEQTGESVEVIYQTFDINETMLSKIEKGKEDYDVVCPSDYIIERMLQHDLLLPIDKDFGDTPNYIDSNIAPYIRDRFNEMVGNGKNANDYAVGYMWGTTGFLYNAAYVDSADVSSWKAIHNPKYADKIIIKDSPRDIYSQIITYVRQDDLKAGRVTLDELMHYTTDEDLLAVEEFMKEAKKLVAGWEADFGKEQMIQERAWINLTWSGDAVWAIEEGKDLGVDLRYSTPKEGFTVWFDGWVIPKYAGNTKAAKYWINFMSRPDVVIRNVDVTGYVACSGAQEVLEAFIDESLPEIDLSYFFGPEASAVSVDPVLYPDASDIARSAMEHDWGDNTHKLIEMWARVKGSNADTTTVVVISVFFSGLIGFALYRKISQYRKYARRRARRRKAGKR